jgi:hypothetical protein
MEDYAETYRSFNDYEIAALDAEIETLTDGARAALEAEIRTRGFTKENLAKLRGKVNRFGKRFDKRERIERKQEVRRFIFQGGLGSWKDRLIVIGGLLVRMAIRSCFHSR